MIPWKKRNLLLLVISSCFALFSSCGTSTTRSPATPTSSGRTPTATSTAVPTAQPTSPPGTCGAWSAVSSPNVGTRTNFLHAVAAISTNDIWAVGSSGDGQSSLTLVEHWNGTQWNVVASPNAPGSTSDELFGVAALASNDIWAVGANENSTRQQTLVEHWNGTAWSIVKSPNIATLANGLAAVTVVSAHDIWAVGSASGTTTTISQSQSLIEHWNGTEWSIVSSSTGELLTSVVAVESNNVWAVGQSFTPGSNGSGDLVQSLILHWNGTEWSVVSSPNSSSVFDTLKAIVTVTGSDIWAVGDYSDTPGDPHASYLPLIEHWNGTRWSIVKSPLQGESDVVNGIVSSSSKNITMVGVYRTTIDLDGPYNTLVEHSNGAQWSVVNSPNPSANNPGPDTNYNDLLAVAAVSESSLWAVGYSVDSCGHDQTLTEATC